MLQPGKSIQIFVFNGIPIKVDWSWIIVFALVSFSLSQAYFPSVYPDSPPLYHWLTGIAGALFLFLSILLHELSHSLVAQWTGIPIADITLFIFGGVARMEDEPETPLQEFWVALAGPGMSLLLALVFGGIFLLIKVFNFNGLMEQLFWYLALINVFVIIFNMAPGFPLDGGRILRAIIWYFSGSLYTSTRIASALGRGLGYLLILWGLYQALSGNLLNGGWFVFIGHYLNRSAKVSMDNVYISMIVGNSKVQEVMTPSPITVRSDITLEQLVSDYFLTYPFNGYPVLAGGSQPLAIRNSHQEVKETHIQTHHQPTTHHPQTHHQLPTDHQQTDHQTHHQLPTDHQQTHPQTHHQQTDHPTGVLGYISLDDIKTIPREKWKETTILKIIRVQTRCCPSVHPRTEIKKAMRLLSPGKADCLLVLDGYRLKGILTYKDISHFITIQALMKE